MESYEYETLYQHETSYWWFRGLHSIIVDTMKGLGLTADSRILDAGCGTGRNLQMLKDNVTPEGFGFDIAAAASPFWPRRNLDRVCLASVNEVPFKSAYFDAVVSVDLLECDAVHESSAFGELCRVLKPGGLMVLVVPAYDWLMSEEHHKAVGASRRYSVRKLKALASRQPTRIIKTTHVFASMLPLVAVYRLLLPFFRKPSADRPVSEIKPMNPIIDEILFRTVKFEGKIMQKMSLPFGSSIMMILEKVQ